MAGPFDSKGHGCDPDERSTLPSRARLHANLANRGKVWADKIVEATSGTWCTGMWISTAVYAAPGGVSQPRRPLPAHLTNLAAVAGLQGVLAALEES